MTGNNSKKNNKSNNKRESKKKNKNRNKMKQLFTDFKYYVEIKTQRKNDLFDSGNECKHLINIYLFKHYSKFIDLLNILRELKI